MTVQPDRRRPSLLDRLTGRARREDERYEFPGPKPRIKPLVDPELRFMVVWSPKSACTTTLIWFLTAAGLGPAARKHDAWPHRYRSGVLYRSPAYYRMTDADVAKMRRIRVIRDPIDRAVSSFRHAVSMGYADAEIGAFLGRAIDPEATFSFREFIAFLEAEDIERTNPHHRVQFQWIEKAHPPTDVINITKTDLFTELNKVEASMGLPVTDFPALDWLHRTEHGRKPKLGAIEGAPDEMRLSRRAGRGDGFWPKTDELLTAEARKRLEAVYRIDLDAYARWL